MRDKYIQTAESVTEGHPDKLCDTIADTVLDNCLEYDPSARVACEALATAGKILVAGEITAKVIPDIPAIVARTVQKAGYETEYEIEVITHDQSTDIAEAVGGDKTASPQQGAGDQGIMYGYACLETDELLPLPVVLAHRLTRLLTDVRKAGTIRGLGPDGKAQVSVEYVFGLPSRITSVVISCQHEPDKTLKDLRREVMEYVVMPALQELPPDEETEILINPSGRFVLGGFEADTGLTGRKLMVDTYGGLVPHGGGALSGKDGTKVDRSGTYMARYIAKNIVAAGLALIVTSPVFLLTAIAIKREDGGPVFYKQERLTKNGKKFYIHKFRSMRVDAEKDGVARLSSGDNDSRITPVGRIIRKIRVDELPQLLDILAGNLSVVGPRPEREEIALQYEKELPEFRLRLQAKAGLTGYAQVYGKYNTTPYDKLQMDLMYIANPSFMEDLRICFATVKILFMPESTEGVAEGATTAMGQEAALEEMAATKVEKE